MANVWSGGFIVDSSTGALVLDGPRAVAPTDVMLNGFYRNPTTLALVAFDVTAGSFMRNGFWCSADGAILVTSTTSRATRQNGFLRAPAGELVITTTLTGAMEQNGFLRAPNWALVVA
jgi:hypothetical protein